MVFTGHKTPVGAGIDQFWILCYYPTMTENITDRRRKKLPKDPIYQAVLNRMTAKGKGFFIISCGPWIHPINTVLNCYAIMFDGSIQYKFEVTMEGYRVAEIRSTYYLTLRLTVGETLTQDELIKRIEQSQ
jgi:hypothetical protein